MMSKILLFLGLIVQSFIYIEETDSDTHLDSDLKPNGYIVLCRNCSHNTDMHSDSDQDLELQSLP